MLIILPFNFQMRRLDDHRAITEWLQSQWNNQNSIVNRKLRELRHRFNPGAIEHTFEHFTKGLSQAERIAEVERIAQYLLKKIGYDSSENGLTDGVENENVA